MKLELKHLAGYLPYGLKFEYSNIFGEKDVKLLEGKDLNDRYTKEIKPILHDIDCIPEECESELEDLGVDKIERAFRYWYKDCEYMYCGVDELPYKAVQCLLKHHIDIHDLIKKDLAININELKQKP